MKSAFSSPGIPKIFVTPSSSKHLINKSDAFIISPFKINFLKPSFFQFAFHALYTLYHPHHDQSVLALQKASNQL